MYPCKLCHGIGQISHLVDELNVMQIEKCPECDGEGYFKTTEEEKAEKFESICTRLHYARVAMNNERIKEILDENDSFIRSLSKD